MALSPMSVHDPMGNTHNKGRTKKKQVLGKEGASTFHSRDENDHVDEIYDQGLRHFRESELKRQEDMRKIKPQKPNLDIKKEGDVQEERNAQTVHGTSNGTLSSDLCQDISNLVMEDQNRNLHDNHASPQDAISCDDGRDLNNASDDGHDLSPEQQSSLNQANGTSDVADGAPVTDPSIHELELRTPYIPKSLGQGTVSYTSSYEKPDSNPSINTNCGIEAAESIRKTPAHKKTPQEQNEHSPTSSVPPTPQPKSESCSPETSSKMVPGGHQKGSGEDEEAEKKKSPEQLKVLEVVIDGSEISDKLSKYLDREMRVIKCWKHLAYVLGVPSDETRKFEMYSEHSPTEDLFVYLSEVWHPDLKIKELKQKLQKIHRNDLIESLNTGLFRDTMNVSDLISGETKFIKLLSPKLDIDSRTIGNWRSLASEFGIRKQQAEQFGLRGSGPSAELFRYIRASVELRNLNMKELQEHFKAMERRDLVNLLKKEFDAGTIEEKALVRDELEDESPLLANIGERLNKDIRAIKNWRNLAYRLKIPAEIYKAFDSSKAEAKSPTKMMFEWLAKWKPSLSVGDLLEGVRKIDRYDVVELVTKEAEIVFQKKMELNSAKQLSDMEQTHQEKSYEKKLISNLKKNAAIKGFVVQGNCGEGNCMFHALSRQLKIKKDIQISHDDLRGEIVEYLGCHRELPKVGDLFSFTYGYESWPKFLKDMAKDGTWGNHVILVAAANKYEIPIRVISSATDHQDIIVEPSSPFSQDIEPLVLGHVFEYHYVSLEQEFMSEIPEGNCQTSSDNRLLSKHLEYGQPPFSATYQQHQQRYPQGPAFNLPEANWGSLGPFQSQSCYPSNRSNISSVLQGQVLCQKSQSKRELLSEEERIEMKVTELPVEVYRKICMKLSVKRNITFDDFRMVAEMLGLDRDTMEFLGQQSNPAEVMFSQFGRNLMVFQLIKILHDIERFDVAAVLEEWVKTGNVK